LNSGLPAGLPPELLTITETAGFPGFGKEVVYRHSGKISRYQRSGELRFMHQEPVDCIGQGSPVRKLSV